MKDFEENRRYIRNKRNICVLWKLVWKLFLTLPDYTEKWKFNFIFIFIAFLVYT